MFVKRNTCLLAFLLCSLTLWCKSTSAGSSFLSPSQKPQGEHLTHDMGGTKASTDGEIIVRTDCIDFIQDPGINKGKPPRVGRQVMEELSQPAVDNHITISPPFDIGFTVREEDFEQYGVVLQIIRQLLGSTEPPKESPTQL